MHTPERHARRAGCAALPIIQLDTARIRLCAVSGMTNIRLGGHQRCDFCFRVQSVARNLGESSPGSMTLLLPQGVASAIPKASVRMIGLLSTSSSVYVWLNWSDLIATQ